MNFFSNFSSNFVDDASTTFTTSSSMQINGRTFEGGNVTITGNKIVIDGKEVYSSDSQIEIIVQGNCGDISSDNGNITVNQNTNNVTTKNGSINIEGSVGGNVDNKNGNISIRGSVEGNCTTKNGNISR